MVREARHNHSLVSRAIFFAKSNTLKVQRTLIGRWIAPADALTRAKHEPPDALCIAQDHSPLYTVTDPRERDLELGKVHNLRTAAALDHIVIARYQTFSFWLQVGRPTAARGYVIGRELRQGCLIPTIAGGICQLSNALHRTALAAGCRIDERHRHSASVDGLLFDPDTDATVYWNYIDLRFTPSRTLLLRVELDADDLHIRLLAHDE